MCMRVKSLLSDLMISAGTSTKKFVCQRQHRGLHHYYICLQKNC